jgi:hypothetical protein
VAQADDAVLLDMSAITEVRAEMLTVGAHHLWSTFWAGVDTSTVTGAALLDNDAG